MPAPDVRSGYNLDLGGYPGADAESVDLDIPCTIVGFDTDDAAGTLRWNLSCVDPDEVAHDVSFTVPLARGANGLAALVELPAQLRVRGQQNFGGLQEGPVHGVGDLATINAALVGDGQVYAFVVDAPSIDADLFTPLLLAVDRDACGVDPPEDDPEYAQHERDMAIRVATIDQEIELHTGQWGEIVAPAEGVGTLTISVDVVEATAMTCCHSTTWVSLVGRTFKEYPPD